MSIFFTSDTHFGHQRIIELSNRPFASVEQMNAELVRRWNEVVSQDDHVYHLGDVALGDFAESMKWLRLLNGTLHLVTGNHDRLFMDPETKNVEKANRYRDRFRPEYQKYFKYIEEGSFDKDTGRAIGAAELLLIPEIKVDLTKGRNSSSPVLRMSHFPYTGDSHDKPRYDLIRPKDDGKVLLHGHTHQSNVVTRSAKGTLQIHVGVDSWDYYPVSEDAVYALIRENQ